MLKKSILYYTILPFLFKVNFYIFRSLRSVSESFFYLHLFLNHIENILMPPMLCQSFLM